MARRTPTGIGRKIDWMGETSRGRGGTREKLGMVVQACGPSIQEAEVKRSGVQGQPLLHTKFKASLDYMAPCQVVIKDWSREYLNFDFIYFCVCVFMSAYHVCGCP